MPVLAASLSPLGAILTTLMTTRRKFILSALLLAGIVVLTIFYCDRLVEAASKGKIYSTVETVPHNHVGLLLGTGKYLAGGRINLYYKYRIAAAAQLIKAGKVDYLVISGDNGREEYNEPEMMKADLVAQGIDSCSIYLDFAGFRTFDSMIRLKKIFSQDSVTIISQDFHNRRALLIAQREGIKAVGFNSQDVSRKSGLKVQMREKLARVKVFADYLFNTEPKFLGPKVNIPQG